MRTRDHNVHESTWHKVTVALQDESVGKYSTDTRRQWGSIFDDAERSFPKGKGGGGGGWLCDWLSCSVRYTVPAKHHRHYNATFRDGIALTQHAYR